MDRKDERRDRFDRKKKYNKVQTSTKLKSVRRKENKNIKSQIEKEILE
jgi:transcriptional regulator NrdR family protein|tara:strand:+ start:49619 stop:49762 length:144 start_codon:yes stop_codon:yes gene_type:complete